MKNIKYIIYIVVIGLGILFFRGGHVLINQTIIEKRSNIDIESAWNSHINIKNEEKIEMTPDYLFNSIPPMDEYPLDKLVYFKHINTRTTGTKAVVTSVIIQNNETLFKNQYYFDISNELILNKIISEDLTSGKIHIIDNSNEMKDLLEAYKSFIDLYLSR